MSGCPFHKLRSDLPALTDRIAALPVDERGYPVPYFVSKIAGKWDFRIADGSKWVLCVKKNLCWVCGEPLGRFKSFTIGPMCAINRTTAEPPEHKDCAEWSVKGCPFLSRPKMVRREDETTDRFEAAGEMIKRNPGATCIWTTTNYELFSDGRGGKLLRIGDATDVSWWHSGRPATREEVEESIRTGLPLLEQMNELEFAHKKAAAREALAKAHQAIIPLLPPQFKQSAI